MFIPEIQFIVLFSAVVIRIVYVEASDVDVFFDCFKLLCCTEEEANDDISCTIVRIYGFPLAFHGLTRDLT